MTGISKIDILFKVQQLQFVKKNPSSNEQLLLLAKKELGSLSYERKRACFLGKEKTQNLRASCFTVKVSFVDSIYLRCNRRQKHFAPEYKDRQILVDTLHVEFPKTTSCF